MKAQEIIEVLQEMNYDKEDRYIPLLEYRDNGFTSAVILGDIVIWDSENDNRRHSRKKGYEPIKKCLKRNIKEVVAQFNKWKPTK